MKARLSHKSLLGLPAALILMAGLVASLPTSSSAALTHRYSFNTDASDSIGAANGILHGGVTVSGAASFDGIAGSFIELPPGMISNYTTLTVEFWMDAGINGNWPELFAFGHRNGANLGANMVMFTPHSGAGDYRMSYAQADPGYLDEYLVNGVGTLDGLGPISVTCVYDPPNNSMSLYTNGVLIRTTSPVTARFSLTNVYNTHSLLGQSLYLNDAAYAGSIDEFRVYDVPLGPLQIAVNAKAGPDTVVTSIVVNSIDWTVNPAMKLGSRQDSTIIYHTAAYGDVTVSGSNEATYSSSDTNILTVDIRGRIFAMATGTATVSASYGTAKKDVVVTVSAPSLAHRYSFTTDASDSVGGANGSLMGSATIQNGSVVLSGVGTSDSPDAYVDLPNDFISSLTTITIEAWAKDNGSANWARIWDFGNSNGGEDVSNGGSRYMFLSLPAGGGDLFGAIHINDRAGGDVGLGWAGGSRPPVGKESHIVWVTDAAHHTGTLYVDGARVGINENMPLTPADIGSMFNNWLGRSQYADPMFNGTINEFRIWEGPISPLQVALDAATGPDQIVTDPGALQAVRLVAPASLTKGGRQGTTLYGDYANVANVNVTTLGTTFASGDTNILTVDAAGVITAVNIGTTTVTATYSGKTDSKSVTVNVKPTVLAYRWSFNEASGTTVTDSIAGKVGTLQGSAAVAGGELALDGVAGYVDLPGNLIDGFDAVSVETWVTVAPETPNDSNARLFVFGSAHAANEIGFTARTGGGNTYLRYFGPPTVVTLRQKSLNTLGKVHVVAVYNPPLGTIDMFVNGVWQNSATNIAFSMKTITNAVSRLGANIGATAFTAANFDELRIYNGALDLQAIRTSMAGGPDTLVTSPGAPTAFSLAADTMMVLGSKQVPHPKCSFASAPNVDLTQTAGVTYSSSDTGVIAVTSDGLLKAAGTGTATVTASFGGKTDSKTITVYPKQVMLVHRYSFTNDASDSVGAQNGALWGNAAITDGQVVFSGDMNGYVELPSRLVSTFDAVTMEVWASFGANAAWPRVYDFGHYNSNGDGGASPYMFLANKTGGDAARIVLSDGTEALAEFSPSLDGLNNVHIVVTYDPPNNKQSIYTNGVLAASSALNGKVLAGVDDLKCWLGRSMYAADNGLTGSIDEFRIYAGAFNQAQISASLAAGPNTVALKPPVTSGPKLTIGTSGSNLVISWPDTATGYALQSTSSLAGTPTWGSVGTPPVQGNGLFTVTLPISAQSAYYRLIK